MKKLIVAFALILLAVGISQAQTSVYLQGRIGNATTLGFKFPSIAGGIRIRYEKGPVELIGDSWISPDTKVFAKKGVVLPVTSTVTLWPIKHIGINGGFGYSVYWATGTNNYRKGQFMPSVGLSIRNPLGKFYGSYIFPTGCEWATSTNPCTIQSPRMKGFKFEQTMDVTKKFQTGFSGSVVRFCDQSNPLVITPRNCHIGGSLYILARFNIL